LKCILVFSNCWHQGAHTAFVVGTLVAAIPERDLYVGVKEFLDVRFQRSCEPPSAIALWKSQITSTIDIRVHGRWTRPDLAAVHVWKHKFAPSFTVDLHGFEVKREDGCDVTSVFEALAHTRIVHFAHLVWHRPNSGSQPELLRSIEDNCCSFGVGLITFSDPADPNTFRIYDGMARRFAPDLALVDRFIDEAIPDHVDTILKWLPGFH
jgi:hypothetical protein